jgi:NhaP-type Na+/H+ or K+/H+ antiporter
MPFNFVAGKQAKKKEKRKKKKEKSILPSVIFFLFGFRLSGSAINQLKKAWEDKESRRNELKIKTKENFQQYEQEIPLKH